MAETSIEWADRSWNFLAGCKLVSPGCTNCYAMRQAARIERMNPALEHYRGLTKPSKAGPVWTGKIGIAEHKLLEPLSVRKPKKWFVNSMSDLFHEDVPDEVIDKAFAIMALCPQHTFQVLTKRSARMREYLANPRRPYLIARRCLDVVIADPRGYGHLMESKAWPVASEGDPEDPSDVTLKTWPLPNVWLGVSVEDQKRADERIPDLLATPAAVRWISAEPLLGPVKLTDIRGTTCLAARGSCCGDRPYVDALRGIQACQRAGAYGYPDKYAMPRGLDWVVVGGESGPGARPIHPDWARSIRDQCASAGVPFFFKQWGEWLAGEANYGQFDERPMNAYRRCDDHSYVWPNSSRVENFGTHADPLSGYFTARRVGKACAGRLLDGREHNEFPSPTGRAE